MVYSAWCCRENVLHVFHEQSDTPMHLTLGQAAKHTGVSKSYLSKLIRTGKITAERQPNGEFRIDPSELDRIPEMRSQGRAENSPRERSDTPENTGWERERNLLMMLLQDREHQIQDLRQERDAWRQQAERAQQTLLLTAGAKHEEPQVRRWWRWRKP
jgi:excisionase family DNA binding protein